MTENFRLDPEALERTKKALADAGEQFSQSLARLGEVLNAHEGCWGDDEIGTAFEKKYQEPANGTRTLAGNAHESINNIAPVLGDVSRVLQEVDMKGARKIDDLLGERLDAPAE